MFHLLADLDNFFCTLISTNCLFFFYNIQSYIDIYRSYDAEQIGNFVKKLAENLYDNSISYETIKLLKAIFESDINKNKISVGFVDNYFSDFCEFINTLDKNFSEF